MSTVLLVTGSVLAFLAAAIHVYIFILESVLWTRPKTWRIFGLTSQADADTTRPLAYNQGFYNLFLAVGIFVGIAVLGLWPPVGLTLVLASTTSMVLAALVLITSSRSLARAAVIQGALPLLAALLIAISLAV